MTGPVTTRFGGAAATKSFTWSYSKLKNGEICLKRHYEIDVAKTWKDVAQDDPNSALAYGNRVHDAMHRRLDIKRPLPPDMVDYEYFVKKVEEKAALPGAQLMVEQKFAFTREFGPCSYFAGNVWYRGIADVLVLVPLAVRGHDLWGAWVADWKTGGIKDEPVQLALMAQSIFAHFPKVIHVKSIYYWLKENAETVEEFARSDMIKFWPSMLRRVAVLEEAARSMNYPPTHNSLCKNFCPVQSCPFHRKEFVRQR